VAKRVSQSQQGAPTNNSINSSGFLKIKQNHCKLVKIARTCTDYVMVGLFLMESFHDDVTNRVLPVELAGLQTYLGQSIIQICGEMQKSAIHPPLFTTSPYRI